LLQWIYSVLGGGGGGEKIMEKIIFQGFAYSQSWCLFLLQLSTPLCISATQRISSPKSTTMTIASNSTCKPSCSKKACCSKFKVVPYEEMERLMNVYGALTAVRNRGAKPSKKSSEKEGEDNGGQVKRESIKRKFYRWFPDLEDRFYRNEDGEYHPINGHENEVNYRKEMRGNSIESVAKKRAKSNQRNKYMKGGVVAQEDMKIELPRADQPLPELGSSRGVLFHIPPPPTRKVTFEEQDIISSSLVSEDEDESSTIDSFFHASGAIFDEVNKEFYGEELPFASIESESSNNESEEKSSGVIISEDDLELWDDGFFGIQFEPRR
jgi:hypothetical protein